MSVAGESIAGAIRRAAAHHRVALVGYLTAGFPARQRFREHLLAIASAADVVEIGVPFTDPMADGMTIQRASHQALQAGVTLAWILEELAALEPRPAAPLLLMSYLNPLLAFGLQRLSAAAAQSGVAGLIVPDLPHEESEDLKRALNEHRIALVQMVTPVTPPERLKVLCRASQGFVYAVTMTGTTGKTVAVPQGVIEYLDRARAASELPVCAGFGIRGPEQVRPLRGHVDGVVVGSALVELLEQDGDPRTLLQSLRS
ncbi:MAG TPA: tryptophan synthase subunit alpha [Steroidobacteraceae bacterium]|nr:tryptophan synthase subunit alpha [Steroidobacteraceae bacterium]